MLAQVRQVFRRAARGHPVMSGAAGRKAGEFEPVSKPRRLSYHPPMIDPRAALNARLAALDAEDAAGQAGQQTVALDQQAVGRLSRMDALQNQAMAQAQGRRRQVERQKIAAALARLDSGDYGFCTLCGEAIAPARLAADPAIPCCLDCMRGS